MKHLLFCCSLLLFASNLKAYLGRPVEKKEVYSLLAIVSREMANVNPSKALKPAPDALSLSRDVNYMYQQKSDCDSAIIKYFQLDIEQADSRNKVMEEALIILLREERELSLKKMQKLLWLGIILSTCALSASIIIYRQSVQKRNKKETETETELPELKQRRNDAYEEAVKLAMKKDFSFLYQFRNIYPEFTYNLLSEYPNMTDSELRLSAMIFLNLSSKEIAECLFMTHRSVQTKKNRLRRKLGITSDTDLCRYFKSFS